MNLQFFIARRYLFSRKSHNAINIVTAISVACVAVVTAALVIILSAMNGLSGLVESLYNTFHADIRITPAKGKVFTLSAEQVSTIRKIPGIAWYTEIVDENVLVEHENQQLIVTMRGVSDDYAKYTRFDTTVRQGHYDLHPHNQTGAIAGQEIGSRLNLGEMSPVNLYVPRRDRNLSVDLMHMDEEPFNRDIAFVSGLYAVSSDFDGKYIILPVDQVRKLMDYTRECTSAEMGVQPGTDTKEVIEKIKNTLGPEFVVQNRFEQNEVLFKTLQSEKAWTFIILLFVLFIATFNTLGSLTLLIIEKKKDIGVLWAMGASRASIRRIFLTEGMLISFTGTVIGLGIGLLVCFLQKQFGLVSFSEGFVVDTYPVDVKITDLGMIIAAVTAIGLLAAWYPVRIYTKRYQTIHFNG